jgi:hypothetical protein
MARIFAEDGDGLTAVKLLAHTDELGTRLDIPASDASRGKRDARLAVLATRLGRADFDHAWEEGRVMTTDEAVDLALSKYEDP